MVVLESHWSGPEQTAHTTYNLAFVGQNIYQAFFIFLKELLNVFITMCFGGQGIYTRVINLSGFTFKWQQKENARNLDPSFYYIFQRNRESQISLGFNRWL